MLIDYKDVSPVKKTVEIEVPAEAIGEEIRRVTGEFGKQARIDGFRAGKVPTHIVRSRFLKEIHEEVLDRLVPRFFREVVDEKSWSPVGSPTLKHVDSLVEGSPLKFEAEFEVKPVIEIGNYRGLPVDAVSPDVSEAEIDEMVEKLRTQAASYRTETERGVRKDDLVVLDLVSSGDGVETRRNDDAHVLIGEETPLPELHENLMGKKPGETFAFDKSYAEDVENLSLRGRTVHYEGRVKEIRVRELPEVTDDFAKSTGGWDSVLAMREKIREDMGKHKERDALRATKQQLTDALIERHDFPVPDSLVEEELVKALQHYARFLASQGVELDKAQIDWEKIRDDFRPDAVKRVKRALLLEEIARRENLEISDVEVDAEIRQAAQSNGRDFAEVRLRLRHDGGYESLRLSLLQEKGLDFLLAESKPR